MLPNTPENWRRWDSGNNVRPVAWNEFSTNRWDRLDDRERAEISVDTVDYYARSTDFAISPLKPQLLNKLGEELCEKSTTHLDLRINAVVLPDERIENNMESLLNYLKEHREVLEDVDFVTYRQLLAKAANREDMDIQAIRCHGKIWIRKLEDNLGHETGSVHLDSLARANGFVEKILEKNEPELRRNGVFKANISISKGYGRILYSGELDAIDAAGQNVEIKSTIHDDWLRFRGRYAFWQCHLGNVDKIILGRIEEGAVKTVSVFSKRHLLSRISEAWSWFSVEKGVGRIDEMMRILRRHLREDGDQVVLERRPWGNTNGGTDWMASEEKTVSETFKKIIEDLFVSE